jgi:hypothetical protein
MVVVRDATMNAIRRQAAARVRASGVGWFLDWIEDVQVVYMDGRVTNPSYDEYLNAVAGDIDGRSDDDHVSILYHVPQPSALSADRRSRLGALLKAREERLRGMTCAYAMATPSLIVRSGLRMLFWLAPPPYPNAVVATPRDGYEFIARHHAAVDPVSWAAEHARLLSRLGPEIAR